MAENTPRPQRPKLFVTRKLPQAVEARMADLFDVTFNTDDKPLSADQISAGIADCDVLVPTVTDRIDADLIARAGDRLKLIANFGTGFEHIDLKAARARDIIVTNTPGVLTEDTADLTMALILSVPRMFVQGAEILHDGNWAGWSPTGLLGHRVNGKTLGIIGMGRIGRAVAQRARAFDMTIHYHNRHRLPDVVEEELGATWHGDLDEMISGVEILTLHCPLNEETRHILDARRIALMRPDAVVVNTARGDLIDEDALGDALIAGEIAGAGLDVYSKEPRINAKLLKAPNTVLLPHLGSATYDGRLAMGDKVIANIRTWSDGHRPSDQVLDGWL